MRFAKPVYSFAVFISLIALLLGGCVKKTAPSFSPGQDGAPRTIPKHLDKVPDATPKVEPLSRYGNRFKNSNTYVTGRKRYTVMPTSRGYCAHGLASWYGTKFHGRKTSSGEPYDMYSMTAAHRTLPLPTYARVTNVENGKSIVVKVNDRGPFHSNRIIDLSYVAAHKLGIIGHGTGKVKVESIDPRDHHGVIPTKAKQRNSLFSKAASNTPPLNTAHKPVALATATSINKTTPNTTKAKVPATTKPSPVQPQRSSPQKMFLQLGAFNQKLNAETFAKKVGSFSNLPTLVTENLNPKGPRFQVRLGPIRDEQQLNSLKQALAKAQFPTPMIIKEKEQ